MTESVIAGEAGDIHVLVEPVPDARGMAIICHPHPLYGGTMHDSVVAALALAARGAQITPVRFNFRGVGRSEGAFDKGVGETEDVLTLSRWLSEELGGSTIYLAGYSFGAGVALAAAQRLQARSLVVVAPPLQMIAPVTVPTLAVLGAKDLIVPVDGARSALSACDGVSVSVLEEADHFFADSLGTIADVAGEFLNGT